MTQDVRLREGGDRPATPREDVRVSVLGPLAVEADGREVHVAGSHRRRLLALLASRPGRMVSVDAIVDALWGEDPPPTAAKTVQTHVVRLRRSLTAADAELIETVRGGYRLAVDPAAVDAVRFERLAADGRRELARGAAGSAAAMLGEALGLWRGPAYGEFGDAEFAAAERVRLDELRLRAMEDLAEAQLASGAAAVPIPELERLVVEEPGRERAWALLMRALYAAGRQHHALVTYQRARRTLAESFGLEPGPELRALERQILDQDPELIVATRPAGAAGGAAHRPAHSSAGAPSWRGWPRRGSWPAGAPARFGCSSVRPTAGAPGWRPSSPPRRSPRTAGSSTCGAGPTSASSHAGLAGDAGTARRGGRRGDGPLPPRAAAARGRRPRVDAADRRRDRRGGGRSRRAAVAPVGVDRRSHRRWAGRRRVAPAPDRGDDHARAAAGRRPRPPRRRRRGRRGSGRRDHRRRRRPARRRPAGGRGMGRAGRQRSTPGRGGVLARRQRGGGGRPRLGVRRRARPRRRPGPSRRARHLEPGRPSPVPRPGRLRAGGRRPVRRPRAARRRARGARAGPATGRGRRGVGQREVVVGAGRPAAARAQRTAAGPGVVADVGDRARGRCPRRARRRRRARRAGAPAADRRPVRGGDRQPLRGGHGHPPDRPRPRRRPRHPRRARRSRRPVRRADHDPPAGRAHRGRPGAGRSADRRRAAADHRGPGPPHRLHRRAVAHRPRRHRCRHLRRRPAAGLGGPGRRVGAPRRRHAHGRPLRGDRRHRRGRRATRRARRRAGPRRRIRQGRDDASRRRHRRRSVGAPAAAGRRRAGRARPRRRRPRRRPPRAAGRPGDRRRPRGRVPGLAEAGRLARGGPRRSRPRPRVAGRRPRLGRRRAAPTTTSTAGLASPRRASSRSATRDSPR